ncbi:MAG: hypothetical protein EOO89_29360 [Pedobacter sp.]|nr:MAG: hypothetical protein EOO89_29360 [Pedobacter sp.]
MKRPFLIAVTILFSLSSYSQLVIDFGKFPVRQNDSMPFVTAEVLAKLNWQALKQYADTAEDHYAEIHTDSLLTVYHYFTQGYETTFELVSYKGMVLEYKSDATESIQPSTSSFFDKWVWLQYVHAMLPALAESFKLTTAENKAVLKAYYQLLGANTPDEYGWICEYGTVGSPTQRRTAVLELLEQHRIDLFRKLLYYPNLQTRLYAIDALIYNDFVSKAEISSAQKQLKQLQREVDSLRRQPKVDNDDIDYLNRITKKGIEQSILEWKAELLTKQEWETVRALRGSKQTVRTCGNAGSYKIYATPIAEVLSDKAIAEIPKNYAGLKRIGYLR